MTFFSATDQNTLIQEGNNVNNFVSLIVNNAGTYTAGITRKTIKKASISGTLEYPFFGEGDNEEDFNLTVDKTYIEWFDLKVIKQTSFDYLDERLDELKKSKENKYKELPLFNQVEENKELTFREYQKANNQISKKEPTPVRALKMRITTEEAMQVKVDNSLVGIMALQLITGNINAAGTTSVYEGAIEDTIEDYIIVNMNEDYYHTFGTSTDDSGQGKYELFLDGYMDYIFNFQLNDEKLLDLYDSEVISAIYAIHIYHYIKQFDELFSENRVEFYSNTILGELKRYYSETLN